MIGELMWSAASLYAMRVQQQTSGFLMVAMQMLCGGAFMLVTAAFTGEFAHFDFAAVSLSSMLAMMYLTFVGSLVGYCAYLWLLRHVEPTRVATYAYVNPIVAVFLRWLFAGEKLGTELLAGSALVVLGIALIVTFRSNATASTAAE